MKTNLSRIIVLAVTILLAWKHVSAQEKFFPKPELQETGFEVIFDGTSLKDWQYDLVYWKIENGVLVGEVTPETILKRNSFIIWRGGTPADFELKMEYRVSSQGNSGINYRSEWVSDPDTRYALKGYQLDIDGAGRWTGQNYEERGRKFIALRGQITRIDSTGKAAVIGSTGDPDQLLDKVEKQDGWNRCHIIARGNVLIHLINDQVMSIVVDEDVQNRSRQGLIGMQVHVGPPMKIEYRNIRLKTY